MTKITQVIDRALVRIQSVSGFSTKTIIPDPYDLAENHIRFLYDGYGLRVGPNSPDFGDFSKETFDAVGFDIVLTKQYISTDSNPDAQLEAVKAILDDAANLRIDLLGDLIEDVVKVDYNGTDAVTFLPDKIITTVVRFTFTIREFIG